MDFQLLLILLNRHLLILCVWIAGLRLPPSTHTGFHSTARFGLYAQSARRNRGWIRQSQRRDRLDKKEASWSPASSTEIMRSTFSTGASCGQAYHSGEPALGGSELQIEQLDQNVARLLDSRFYLGAGGHADARWSHQCFKRGWEMILMRNLCFPCAVNSPPKKVHLNPDLWRVKSQCGFCFLKALYEPPPPPQPKARPRKSRQETAVPLWVFSTGDRLGER